MFCMKCGTQVSENENFCPNCGNVINKVSEKKESIVGQILGSIFAVIIIVGLFIGGNIAYKYADNYFSYNEKKENIKDNNGEDVEEDEEKMAQRKTKKTLSKMSRTWELQCPVTCNPTDFILRPEHIVITEDSVEFIADNGCTLTCDASDLSYEVIDGNVFLNFDAEWYDSVPSADYLEKNQFLLSIYTQDEPIYSDNDGKNVLMLEMYVEAGEYEGFGFSEYYEGGWYTIGEYK